MASDISIPTPAFAAVSSAREPLPSLPFTRVLGRRIHCIGMEEALGSIDTFVRQGAPRHVVTADASMLVMAQHDAELRGILDAAAMVTPDSAGVLWAARRGGAGLSERVSGVDLVERLCELSPSRRYRIYFLGGAPGVAERAAARMQERYPGICIAGWRHGYFTPEETGAVLSEIQAANPHILCVAMGIPLQEKWIASHRAALGVPVQIGVGGTLDVLSGHVRRAPSLLQKARLEWLWRLASRPSKIRKVLLLPRFVWQVWRADQARPR